MKKAKKVIIIILCIAIMTPVLMTYSASLVKRISGTNGADGVNGTDGIDGVNGTDGVDGDSAYQLAVASGYNGTLSQWLTSLKGTDGVNGMNGNNGMDGEDGKSAYQIAVDNGFTGSEMQWLASLTATPPVFLPKSEYTNEEVAITYMNSQEDKTLSYVYDDKVYTAITTSTSESHCFALLGYRASSSAGGIVAQGQSILIVIPTATLTSPYTIQVPGYAVSQYYHVYGSNTPTGFVTAVKEDSSLNGCTTAFEVANPNGYAYIAFAIGLQVNEDLTIPVVINGKTIQAEKITDATQLVDEAFANETTSITYIDTGIQYTYRSAEYYGSNVQSTTLELVELSENDYINENSAINFMNQNGNANIAYRWNKKIYMPYLIDKPVAIGLQGYRMSLSGGGLEAWAGGTLVTLKATEFTEPYVITLPDGAYVSQYYSMYGSNSLTSAEETVLSDSSLNNCGTAFTIPSAKGKSYICFTLCLPNNDCDLTVNGLSVPIVRINNTTDLVETNFASTEKVLSYITGYNEEQDGINNQVVEYLSDKNAYIMPAPTGYCESNASYTSGTNYFDIYEYNIMSAMFETLISDHTDYITKVLLGKDQSNTYDMYYYILNDPSEVINNGSKIISQKPTVILTAGLHGAERDSVHTVYHLMDDLCNHYYDNNELLYLRTEVQFVIVPFSNPWGYVNRVNTNCNEVNLNNNFEYGFGATTGSSWGNNGESANSEAETQHLITVFDTFKDAVLHVECHGKGDVDSVSTNYWFSLMDSMPSNIIELSAQSAIRSVGKRLYELELNAEKEVGGYLSYYGLGGKPKDYTGEKYGMLSLTYEGARKLYGESNYSVNTQKLNVETLENFILNVFRLFNSNITTI